MSLSSNESVADIHIVKLNGPLNVSQAEAVIQRFRDIAEQSPEQVVVDLEDVRFIDSRGLFALVTGYKLFGSESQNFRLAAPQDQPKLLFELTGFDHIFQIFDTVAEAVAAESNIEIQLPMNPPAYVLPLTTDLAV